MYQIAIFIQSYGKEEKLRQTPISDPDGIPDYPTWWPNYEMIRAATQSPSVSVWGTSEDTHD